MKVLIFTQHLHPMQTTATLRLSAMNKYLPEHGIKPVFVTTMPQTTKAVAEYEASETSEIIRVDCPKNWFQRVQHKKVGTIIGKASGAMVELLENRLLLNPLRSLLNAALDYHDLENVDGAVASGPSFALFGVCDAFSKKTGIPWVADYRDDWSSNEEVSRFSKFKYGIEKNLEKRYVSSASAFVSVSEYQRKKISKVTSKDGFLVPNGFEENSVNIKAVDGQTGWRNGTAEDTLKLIYPGTLYQSQDLSLLSKVLTALSQSDLARLDILFVGSASPHLLELARKFVSIRVVGERLFKCDADALLYDADLALHFAYRKKNGTLIKGVPSSKLYEYLRFRKPVLLIPGDDDVMTSTLEEAGLAVKIGNKEEGLSVFTDLLREKERTGAIFRKPNEEIIASHSRARLIAELASNLKEMFDGP
jgi:hypothetical protein